MATSGTYYIDTADFSTATAVWTDIALTTKAPDGYYSFGGNYRQQIDGLLLSTNSCSTPPPPVDTCDNYTFWTNGDSCSLTYTPCGGTEPQIISLGGASGYEQAVVCMISGSGSIVGNGNLTFNGTCS